MNTMGCRPQKQGKSSTRQTKEMGQAEAREKVLAARAERSEQKNRCHGSFEEKEKSMTAKKRRQAPPLCHHNSTMKYPLSMQRNDSNPNSRESGFALDRQTAGERLPGFTAGRKRRPTFSPHPQEGKFIALGALSSGNTTSALIHLLYETWLQFQST